MCTHPQVRKRKLNDKIIKDNIWFVQKLLQFLPLKIMTKYNINIFCHKYLYDTKKMEEYECLPLKDGGDRRKRQLTCYTVTHSTKCLLIALYVPGMFWIGDTI